MSNCRERHLKCDGGPVCSPRRAGGSSCIFIPSRLGYRTNARRKPPTTSPDLLAITPPATCDTSSRHLSFDSIHFLNHPHSGVSTHSRETNPLGISLLRNPNYICCYHIKIATLIYLVDNRCFHRISNFGTTALIQRYQSGHFSHAGRHGNTFHRISRLRSKSCKHFSPTSVSFILFLLLPCKSFHSSR